jgi:hypothetical protein
MKNLLMTAALLFSASNANATSLTVIRVECHETKVITDTTNNVVTKQEKTNNVVVYEIKEADGVMYPVMYNEQPVYNGMVTYIKTSPQAVVLDDYVYRSWFTHPEFKVEKKLMLNRITGDLSDIYSTFEGGTGMSITITGHCEPVTLTPKF